MFKKVGDKIVHYGILFIGCFLLVSCGTLSTTGVKPVVYHDKRAVIRLELATNYYKEAKFITALGEVETALRMAPKYADAYNLRGLIYMQIPDLIAAENNFKRAVVLSNNESSIVHNYAWLLCQTGRYEQANQLFEQVLSDVLYQNKVGTYFAQAVCQSKNKQTVQADVSFRKALNLEPRNSVILYEFAKHLFAKQDFHEAQQQLRKINNNQFSDAKSLWLGVRVERKLGQQEAVFQLTQQLGWRYPNSQEWQWSKGRQYNKQSD